MSKEGSPSEWILTCPSTCKTNKCIHQMFSTTK